MNKKMWLGFLAGAVFALGLLVTCGTDGKGGATRTANAGGGDAGSAGGSAGGGTAGGTGGTGGSSSGGATVWEYAAYKSFSDGLEMPPTVTPPNLSACQTSICVLNAMGADGWELVTINSSNNYFYFKRPK